MAAHISTYPHKDPAVAQVANQVDSPVNGEGSSGTPPEETRDISFGEEPKSDRYNTKRCAFTPRQDIELLQLLRDTDEKPYALQGKNVWPAWQKIADSINNKRIFGDLFLPPVTCKLRYEFLFRNSGGLALEYKPERGTLEEFQEREMLISEMVADVQARRMEAEYPPVDNVKRARPRSSKRKGRDEIVVKEDTVEPPVQQVSELPCPRNDDIGEQTQESRMEVSPTPIAEKKTRARRPKAATNNVTNSSDKRKAGRPKKGPGLVAEVNVVGPGRRSSMPKEIVVNDKNKRKLVRPRKVNVPVPENTSSEPNSAEAIAVQTKPARKRKAETAQQMLRQKEVKVEDDEGEVPKTKRKVVRKPKIAKGDADNHNDEVDWTPDKVPKLPKKRRSRKEEEAVEDRSEPSAAKKRKASSSRKPKELTRTVRGKGKGSVETISKRKRRMHVHYDEDTKTPNGGYNALTPISPSHKAMVPHVGAPVMPYSPPGPSSAVPESSVITLLADHMRRHHESELQFKREEMQARQRERSAERRLEREQMEVRRAEVALQQQKWEFERLERQMNLELLKKKVLES